MNKVNKFIIHFLIIAILLITQVSFLPSFLPRFGQVNLILLAAIFITVIFSFRLGLIYALAGGFCLELFSVFSFGLLIAGLAITVFFIDYLFGRFLTNRSFYSLLTLGAIGTFFYQLLILLFSYLTFLLNFNDWHLQADNLYWQNIGWQILWHLILLSIAFLVARFVSKRLKPNFLSGD